jgi:Ca2+-binding RTX toxin-like protein
MFDMSLMLYMLLFAGVFALDIGVFDMFGGDDETDDATAPVFAATPGQDILDGEADTPGPDPDGPSYVAADYSARVNGSEGDDSAVAGADDSGVAYFLGGGNDTLIATDGDDYADGGDGNDTLTLLDGDDTVAGGGGDDTIRGGEGDDALWGQDGNDTIEGHGGDDLIQGGSGDDTIEGGYGDDTIYGGDGNDTISTDTLTSPSQMGRGLDIVDGGAGDDNIFLGDGDVATGGEGADVFTVYDVVSPDAPPAHITDFDASSDALHIQYFGRDDPGTGDPIDPGLAVAYDADADTTSVSLFGARIATLDGDAGITEAAVTLTEIT